MYMVGAEMEKVYSVRLRKQKRFANVRFGMKAEMDSPEARLFQLSKPHRINFLHPSNSHIFSMCVIIYFLHRSKCHT